MTLEEFIEGLRKKEKTNCHYFDVQIGWNACAKEYEKELKLAKEKSVYYDRKFAAGVFLTTEEYIVIVNVKAKIKEALEHLDVWRDDSQGSVKAIEILQKLI